MSIINAIYAFDYNILNSIQSGLVCTPLNYFFREITEMGDGGIVWIAIAVMLLFTKKHRRYGLIMLFALAIGTLLGVSVFKPIFCRLRPYIESGFTTFIKPPGGYSFPSGHTLSSTAAAAVLFYADRKSGIAAVVLASLVAFSRMYFYVHFPTDILAGFFIGIASAFICIKAAGKKDWIL